MSEREVFLKSSAKSLALIGVVGALYSALSLLVFPLASGAVQIRLGEALTILPLFFPETAIALFVGCVLVNFITGCSLLEVLLGSLVTLLAGICTAIIGKTVKKKWLKVAFGGLFPVLLNAFILPLIWYWCYGQLEYVYALQVALIFVGQFASVYFLGSLVFYSVEKTATKNGKEYR